MGMPHSEEPGGEQEMVVAFPGVQENSDSASSHGPLEGVITPLLQQQKAAAVVTDSPTAAQAALSTPISLATPSPISSIFGGARIYDGYSPETAATSDSDGEGDLISQLRKHRKVGIVGETYEVIRQDAWESLNIELWDSKSTYETKKQQDGKHDSISKVHKHRSLANKQQRIGIQRFKQRDKSSHPSNKGRKRRYPDDQNHDIDISRTRHRTTDSRSVKRNRLVPSNINHNSTVHPTRDHTASLSNLGSNAVQRSRRNGEREVDVPKTKPRVRSYRTGEKSKLSHLRRPSRHFRIHADTVSEPDIQVEHYKSRFIDARIDSGHIPSNTRPPTTPAPQPDGIRVPDGEHERNQLPCRSPAWSSHLHDDLSQGLKTPPSLRTQFRERDAIIIQRFKGRQRTPKFVLPKYKWGYAIKLIDNADIILDDEEWEKRAVTRRVLTDRREANELLNKLSLDMAGGLEEIVSRTMVMEGPERLLKVDVTFSNGEHYLMWVERGWVELNTLNKRMAKQKRWEPTPRLKIPHYVVTCQLITFHTTPVTRSEEDRDNAMSLSDESVQEGCSGMEITASNEMLPPRTFTPRELANEHAGRLFLEKLKVDRRIANDGDAFWWEHNALPEHRKATAAARAPGGLYDAKMDVVDMNSRLGWDQILVNVHKVNDITGPTNF